MSEATVTVHLEQRGVDVKLGKPLATRGPGPDAFRMGDVMRLLPGSVVNQIVAQAAAGDPPEGAVPSGLPAVGLSGWGWGYTFGQAGWGIAGNGPGGPGSNLPPGSSALVNGAGDCWWAMFLHRLRMWAKIVGRSVPAVSDLCLLTQYAAYIASTNGGHGYDLQTGVNDLGTDPLGAYAYLGVNPFHDDAGNSYPVGKIVSLTPGNMQEHLVSTKLFEGTGVGVQLQQAQVDQFDIGQPLAYVKGSPVVGGHELLQAGPNGMIEWGERVGFELSFIERCNDQSEATLGVEMFNTVTGKDATGADEVDVEAYVAAFLASFGAAPVSVGIPEVPAPDDPPTTPAVSTTPTTTTPTESSEPAQAEMPGEPEEPQAVLPQPATETESSPVEPSVVAPTEDVPAEVAPPTPAQTDSGQDVPVAPEQPQEGISVPVDVPAAPAEIPVDAPTPEQSEPLPPAVAGDLPTMPLSDVPGALETYGDAGNTIQGQRAETVESDPDPEKYRQQRADGEDWGPEMSGPFPGV